MEDRATGKGFIEFWTYAVRKGLMAKATAEAIQSASRVVLSTVEPEGWESIDVRSLDLDPFIQRFERLKMSDLKPESLKVYGQRVRTGIAAYLRYLENPTSWSYPTAESRASGDRSQARRSSGQRPPRPGSPTGTVVTLPNGAAAPTITYPYPLRPGLVINVTLPADLSRQEASRLAAFLSSLSVEPQAALPAGPTATDRDEGVAV